MRFLRITLVALAAIAVAASPSLAQRGRMGGMDRMSMGRMHAGGPQGQRPFAGMLLQGITLTSAQQAQIDSIHTSFMSRMPAAAPRMRPDSTTRAQRWALMDERRAALRGVLTAEQQAVWDRNVEQMGARRPRRP